MWELVADYYGQLCAQLVLTVSPHVIVFGGNITYLSLFTFVYRFAKGFDACMRLCVLFDVCRWCDEALMSVSSDA